VSCCCTGDPVLRGIPLIYTERHRHPNDYQFSMIPQEPWTNRWRAPMGSRETGSLLFRNPGGTWTQPVCVCKTDRLPQGDPRFPADVQQPANCCPWRNDHLSHWWPLQTQRPSDLVVVSPMFRRSAMGATCEDLSRHGSENPRGVIPQRASSLCASWQGRILAVGGQQFTAKPEPEPRHAGHISRTHPDPKLGGHRRQAPRAGCAAPPLVYGERSLVRISRF